MLGDRVSVIKILALVIVTAGAMFGNHLLTDAHEFTFSGMVLLSQTLMLATMLLLRMQRLRFVKSMDG